MSPFTPQPNSLEKAISESDLAAVQTLYAGTAPAQQPAFLAKTAERAARRAQITILDWCFRAGLAVPQGETLNNELYDQACFSRSPAVFEVLAAHGWDLNAHHSEFVGDALSLAAYHGDTALAEFLLEHGGVDPNQAWGYQEHEAGVWAVVGPHRSPEFLRTMLSHGWKQADSTAHIAAAEHGDMEILRLLVEAGSAKLEATDPWWGNPTEIEADRWGTALYRAALKGQEDAVAYLLEKGADPSFKDEKGRSCAWAAREGGSQRIVEMLEEKGVKE
ncbi:ankyrin repeat-containing protein [Daldinia caldariorum]|uniref:ankyrin repeat-containing protein n=1 Tax=Daldinia caldariorum TaxID=326644 RepID=UPI002008948A|nr:ankyrin repeat-containing protein [Daldinia caldariorum]KAI1463480.1 ankyrin repeat-containing protein [Daldinia caldariorum]